MDPLLNFVGDQLDPTHVKMAFQDPQLKAPVLKEACAFKIPAEYVSG